MPDLSSDLKVHIRVDTAELDEAMRVLSNSVAKLTLRNMIAEEVKRQMADFEKRILMQAGIQSTERR